MAVDAVSVSVQLGIPQQTTTAGLVLLQGPNPPASSPYWNYDGTNLNGNVPTGKGFLFSQNGGSSANFTVTYDVANTLTINQPNGSGGYLFEFGGSGSTGVELIAGGISGNKSDGVGVVALTIGNGNTLTATSKALLDVQNNGTDAFVVMPGNSGGGIAVCGVAAAKTAAYSAGQGDFLVQCDPNAAAGSFAVTLPLTTSVPVGMMITVKVVTTHATHVITVIKQSTDVINGVTAGQTTTTFTTTATLASATFISDGAGHWDLVASNGTVT